MAAVRAPEVEEEVAVVVDGGDEGVAVEVSSTGLEIQADESVGGAPPDVGNDLASEMGDAYAGMTDMPTMDANAAANQGSNPNEFDDFLSDGVGVPAVQEAPLGDENVHSDELQLGDSSEPMLDEMAVVPPLALLLRIVLASPILIRLNTIYFSSVS